MSNALLFLLARLPAMLLATTRAIAKAVATALHPVAASPLRRVMGRVWAWPGCHEEGSYSSSGPPGLPEQRPGYLPDQGGYDQGYQQGATTYGRQDMAAALTTTPRVLDTPQGWRGNVEPAGRSRPIRRSGLRSASARWLQRLRAGAAMGPPERRLRCGSTTAADALPAQ